MTALGSAQKTQTRIQKHNPCPETLGQNLGWDYLWAPEGQGAISARGSGGVKSSCLVGIDCCERQNPGELRHQQVLHPAGVRSVCRGQCRAWIVLCVFSTLLLEAQEYGSPLGLSGRWHTPKAKFGED